jgi:signal transduction histidine kinase
MKLIAKYNRVTIPIIIGILLISSIGYYFILHRILIYQLDKDLRVEQTEIIQHLKETGQLPETSDYKDQQISFHSTNLVEFKDRYSTQDVYNKREHEMESFRRIDFLVIQGDKYFIATVKKSQQETEDIVRLILMITFFIIAILLLILFISNRFLLSNLWKPFRNTLEQLNQFNFFSKNKIALQKTDIDEFKELNETVLFMTQKVTLDYQMLKGFTENASHEIQTPLAIIKNKVELLSQSENLTEAQINVLQSLNEAAARLSRLNQSLLLLAKIENLQFTHVDTIDFSSMLKRYIDNFDELAQAKGLRISKNIEDNVIMQMNESLAEILISNVISNAIKHNLDNGNITVEFNKNHFRVSNTGPVPHGDTSELFERFKKESSSGDSLGLGLSIVKTITDIYGFSISYHYEMEQHIVEIIFHNSAIE